MLKEKSIKTEIGKVYYWINNNLPDSDVCIVFCHGLTADHSLFEKQIDFFSPKYQILLWDIPLHGKSIPYENFTYDNVVSDLNTIIERERLSKLIFVGQSGGGYISQAYISQYPDKARGFVGIGTTPFGMKYYKKSELFWVKHFATMASLYPYSVYCKACSRKVAVTSEARQNMFKTWARLGKKNMLKATKAVYQEFLKVKESVRFPFPILLTYGEYDRVGLVAKYNQNWAKKTDAKLEVIKNASHNANFDNPVEFNLILEEYIKERM
ncbi:MAG: alpha/beta hydrolase [Bacteroidales bacterium]|jgi:pimeloyl-ACP methyl ester carboxylesterase|nr:alpha/beta hydrolase [Bacteroidota bacterium]NLN99338.1 alpha/beta hydrolase [Bacteroidales bacterium]